MPWSWVRVSTQRVRSCGTASATTTSAATVRACVTEIVAAADGEVGLLDFEVNGKWARLRFRWDNVEVKRNVIYDLQADHVVDIISDDERDELQLRDS